MASVNLTIYEVRTNLLPDVCMRCGEPATTRKYRNFAWYPPWITGLIVVGLFFTAILIVGAIVALVMRKRMGVSVPVCDAHKNHWLVRIFIALTSFVGLVGLVVSAIALRDMAISAYFPMGLLLALMGWIILIVTTLSTAIRPTNITDSSITLRGVSETFVQAVRAWRGRFGDEAYFDPQLSPRQTPSDALQSHPRRRLDPDERISGNDPYPGRSSLSPEDDEERASQ